MRFLVITDAPTLKKEGNYAAYAPYVKEMGIWFDYANEITIISPTTYNQKLLLSPFKKIPKVISVPSLNFTSFYSILKSFLILPIITFRLIIAMSKTDHIHLRCPGNIGLLGCLVQIFFPKKIKTAKYAGNWDPKAKQPLSYRFQKWLLSNTFLTKNMTVLVYGDWKNESRNIKSFFTASFKASDKEDVMIRNYKTQLQFVFVGSLVFGKRPDLAIKIVASLIEKGFDSRLTIFGDGVLKEHLETYAKENNLIDHVIFEGNKPNKIIKETLKQAHFLVLPSKSEGWPKAIAEAMFFGAIPISTSISCVPYMLGHGNRGILIEPNVETAVLKIIEAINHEDLNGMSKLAAEWSQKFTLEYFESEIKKLLSY